MSSFEPHRLLCHVQLVAIVLVSAHRGVVATLALADASYGTLGLYVSGPSALESGVFEAATTTRSIGTEGDLSCPILAMTLLFRRMIRYLTLSAFTTVNPTGLLLLISNSHGSTKVGTLSRKSATVRLVHLTEAATAGLGRSSSCIYLLIWLPVILYSR